MEVYYSPKMIVSDIIDQYNEIEDPYFKGTIVTIGLMIIFNVIMIFGSQCCQNLLCCNLRRNKQIKTKSNHTKSRYVNSGSLTPKSPRSPSRRANVYVQHGKKYKDFHYGYDYV